MTLFADDDLGLVVGFFQPLAIEVITKIELFLAFMRLAFRLFLGQVIFVSIDEQHHIRVLLDRA